MLQLLQQCPALLLLQPGVQLVAFHLELLGPQQSQGESADGPGGEARGHAGIEDQGTVELVGGQVDGLDLGGGGGGEERLLLACQGQEPDHGPGGRVVQEEVLRRRRTGEGDLPGDEDEHAVDVLTLAGEPDARRQQEPGTAGEGAVDAAHDPLREFLVARLQQLEELAGLTALLRHDEGGDGVEAVVRHPRGELGGDHPLEQSGG